MEFLSKKDAWLYPIFFVVIGACFAPIFAEGNIFFCFSTKYIVGEETITIRSGFVKKRILIRDIKQILNTKIQ